MMKGEIRKGRIGISLDQKGGKKRYEAIIIKEKKTKDRELKKIRKRKMEECVWIERE